MELEGQSFRVPFEQLQLLFRNGQRSTEKELSVLEKAVKNLTGKKEDIKPEDAANSISKVITRLETLRNKLTEVADAESTQLSRMQSRLDHVHSLVVGGRRPDPLFLKDRLHCMLVDHMLRSGYFDSARQLAHSAGIEQLVDVEVFEAAQRVIVKLKERSVAEALQWCADNKSKLRKLKSRLEYEIRFQEYVEMVRNRKLMDALVYFRKYLAAGAVPVSTSKSSGDQDDDGAGGGGEETEEERETRASDLETAMGCLAFSPNTSCPKYKELFDSDARWARLVTLFQRELCNMFGFPEYSLLELTLQAGLSALKTPFCVHPDTREPNCPVCGSSPLGSLAGPLPFGRHTHSVLMCHLSGRVMDENNLPMALEAMAAENDGFVICPRTNERFRFSELKKMYITA